MISDENWLASRVNKTKSVDQCWLYTGPRNAAGYGRFRRRRKNSKDLTTYAHRVAWEVANNQKIPAGLIILHKCDNPPCCNPNHLTLGTLADNNNDTKAKGRSALGVKNASSKLTPFEVKGVRILKELGVSTKELSYILPITENNIYSIIKYKIWKHI